MKLSLLVVLMLCSSAARAQDIVAFMAGNAKTAATLTDDKVEKFFVFWKVRAEFSSSATPAVLSGLKDGGYDGVVAAAKQNEKVFKSAEEAAAAKSGLSEQEGMALFSLLSTHYLAIYQATKMHDEATLTYYRTSFVQKYGQAAADIVLRHEREAVPLVTQQMDALKAQMQKGW